MHGYTQGEIERILAAFKKVQDEANKDPELFMVNREGHSILVSGSKPDGVNAVRALINLALY